MLKFLLFFSFSTFSFLYTNKTYVICWSVLFVEKSIIGINFISQLYKSHMHISYIIIFIFFLELVAQNLLNQSTKCPQNWILPPTLCIFLTVQSSQTIQDSCKSKCFSFVQIFFNTFVQAQKLSSQIVLIKILNH